MQDKPETVNNPYRVAEEGVVGILSVFINGEIIYGPTRANGTMTLKIPTREERYRYHYRRGIAALFGQGEDGYGRE